MPLCWSNCCVVPFAMADAPPRFFVDPGGCRRERVAPKRPAPRDLRPVVHSAYEDENKQGLGYNEHDPFEMGFFGQALDHRYGSKRIKHDLWDLKFRAPHAIDATLSP
jgi:hypothetical protein